MWTIGLLVLVDACGSKWFVAGGATRMNVSYAMPMPTPGLQKEFTGEMDKHLLSFIIECPSFTRHSLTRWTNSIVYRRTKTAVNFAKSILRCRLQQEFTKPSCGRIGDTADEADVPAVCWPVRRQEEPRKLSRFPFQDFIRQVHGRQDVGSTAVGGGKGWLVLAQRVPVLPGMRQLVLVGGEGKAKQDKEATTVPDNGGQGLRIPSALVFRAIPLPVNLAQANLARLDKKCQLSESTTTFGCQLGDFTRVQFGTCAPIDTEEFETESSGLNYTDGRGAEAAGSVQHGPDESTVENIFAEHRSFTSSRRRTHPHRETTNVYIPGAKTSVPGPDRAVGRGQKVSLRSVSVYMLRPSAKNGAHDGQRAP
ncbi:hypothetical protein Bbelb_302640 [Branchiostoma belcheri]|nr:hypothetical protein Bbelb_302640 [Branchiostoma belcheri]